MPKHNYTHYLVKKCSSQAGLNASAKKVYPYARLEHMRERISIKKLTSPD